jgi:hypothetical protein
MIGVAVVAVASRIAATAYHVDHDPECRWLVHEWKRTDLPDLDQKPTTTVCVPPFWPQFWRKLLYQPWPGTYLCDETREICMLGVVGIGPSTECRPHKYVGSHAVSREEAGWIEATIQSLKTIGPPLKPIHGPSNE